VHPEFDGWFGFGSPVGNLNKRAARLARWRRRTVIQLLRHAPPAPLPPLPGSEPGPDALEVQVAHGVLQALVPHRATRAQFPGTGDVCRIPREEWVDLASTGCLLTPVQRPVRFPMPAIRSGC
jgi:hypothetical protein